MRYAILSDIHGNLPALEAVLADLKQHSPDRVINLGDCVSGPLWPAETSALLKAMDWDFVLGNHDGEVSQGDPEKMGPSDRFAYDQLSEADRQWLGNRQISWLVPGLVPFLVCHGTPFSNRDYLVENVRKGQLVRAPAPEIITRLGHFAETASTAQAPRLIFCGHSHIPSQTPVSPHQLVVNVGSVGLPAYDDQPIGGEAYISESGSLCASYVILTLRGGGFTLDMRSVAYDNEAAARRAEAMGRKGWAQALRTGRMN